ncbi:hypothetical protein PENSPDRAFT_595333, partial [Peniophora sp. CONT]
MCTQGKITGGLSGYLQQEFRELELLNEITKLRWEGNLRAGVGGNTRSTLLKSYISVYGKKSCPSNVHHAVRWGKPGDKELKVDYEDDEDFVWKTFDTGRSKAKAKGGTDEGKDPGSEGKVTKRKRKRTTDDNGEEVLIPNTDLVRPAKKLKSNAHTQTLRGLRWDALTQSCAYDSLLSILSNIYYLNARDWADKMS